MKTMNPHPDYYPVYKDIAELAITDLSEGDQENYPPLSDNCRNNEVTRSGSIESALMFDTDSLVGISCESDLSAFQAHILLLKNAFEGHVFLNFSKSPFSIFNEGIYGLNCNTESLTGSFFEHIDYYLTGLRNGWKMILENEKAFRDHQPEKSLQEICFEEMMYDSLSRQLFRFPVSYLSNIDIFRYGSSRSNNLPAARNLFNLIMKCESAFKDYLYLESINKTYTEIFEDELRMLDLKQNVLQRYDLKLFFAHNRDIRNEEDLEDRISDYISETRTGNSGNLNKQVRGGNLNIPEKNKTVSGFEAKTRLLYRSVSVNCREANDNPGCENKYPELFRKYYEKEKINREIVTGTSGSIIKYLRLLQILSEILVYRKTNGLAVHEGSHSYPETCRYEPLSESDFISVTDELDNMVAYARINGRADAKSNYISDEFMIKTHREYLQKQIEFIDKEICRIQEDIRNVLKSK